nr:MAG TPA: hypothetical protein [Caudoviricetes sp.]DAO28996.1 MAG TPA: hypothetical protein [Caudoviricetes sp.]
MLKFFYLYGRMNLQNKSTTGKNEIHLCEFLFLV